jgi:hypothetical protein
MRFPNVAVAVFFALAQCPTASLQLKAIRVSTMPSSELTAELQRVFGMLGGSTHKPVLDANTVALVLSQLGGSAAPEQDVQQVMAALRAGPDNVITYAQFEAALCEWLDANKQSTSSSTSSPSDARKRKSRASDEHCSSRRVLTGVSSFFTQFRPRQEVKLEDLEDSDDDSVDDSTASGRVAAKDKIELLHYISRTLAAFPALVDAARSANVATVCEAVSTLERALQVAYPRVIIYLVCL